MITTTRNADLTDIVALLRDQHARKVDVVAPANAIRSRDGRITITGSEPVITDDGVTNANGTYAPTTVALEGIADRLGMPVAYTKGTHAARPDIFDANVNGWLHGRRPMVRPDGTTVRKVVPGDTRSFLLRAFRGDDTDQGILRAVLSDRYQIVDNLDVLMAALDGIRETGLDVQVRGGDITDRRMVLRVTCPEVAAFARALLAGYRSPFTGEQGTDNPTVWAGFQIANSEVGGGRFTITPRLEVQVCRNGLVIAREAIAKTHIGGRLDDGVVRWASDTQQKAIDLVKAQTRDAVRTFLSPEYLSNTITRLERRAGEEVDTHDAVKAIVKPLRYTDTQVDGILAHFTRGGQMTLGGVVNAITAYAQDVNDGDAAYDLEARAATLLGV